MARNVSPFRLGLFILACGSIGVISLVWLGASHFFEDTKTYASYFDESVRGLQKDAIVNFRGVAVGRVASIGLAPDGRLIEILLRLKANFQVDKRLAVQLREQGLTGMRYLEIDTAPEDIANLTPALSFTPRYSLIPSYPSEIAQLKSALETIYEKIKELDLKGLSESWQRSANLLNGILAKVGEGMDSREWKETLAAVHRTATDTATLAERLRNAMTQEGLNEGFADLGATLEATRQASEALARQLNDLPRQSVAKAFESWKKTLDSGGTFIANVDQRTAESAVQLQHSLQQLGVLLGQLNSLVQTIREQPNRLIFPSKQPDPFERK